MKIGQRLLVGVLLGIGTVGQGQQVRIDSFSGNGLITWQAPSNSDCTLEWASSLLPTATWSRTWLDLVNVHCTNGATTASVPMFYRVAAWTNGLFVRLPVGRTYRFASTNMAGRTWTQEVFCAGGITIPSTTNNYMLLARSDHYSGSQPAGSDQDGMMMIRATDKAAYALFGAAEEMLYWQNAPIGTSWTNAIGVCVIETNETITVPAGTFTGCVKIRHLNDNSCEWVKPGFFMVRSEFLIGDPDGPASSVLESWLNK
jgi:hypothetical protein